MGGRESSDQTDAQNSLPQTPAILPQIAGFTIVTLLYNTIILI